MSHYETMYIAHPALEGGRLKDLILSVEQSMNKLGGTTHVIDVWGKKKLAYPVNKERYGVYILLQFENKGSTNKEFNLELEHNPNILAYLTTKIDQNKILTDIADLDVQLGLVKPPSTEDSKTDSASDSEASTTEKSIEADSKDSEAIEKDLKSDETIIEDSDNQKSEEE